MLTAFVPLMLLPLPPALLIAAAVAVRAPEAGRTATLVLALLGLLLDIFFLVGGTLASTLQLPLGLPGIGLNLGLDALAGFFLLPVLLAGVATALFGLGRPRSDKTATDGAGLAVTLAGFVLLLLAADGMGLLLGLGLAAAGGAGLMPAEAAGALRGRWLRFVLVAAGVVGLVGLLAPVAGGVPDLRFVAMHASVPAGWRAVAALLLVLLTGAAAIGLWPFLGWVPLEAGVARGAGAALVGGIGPVLGLYILTRALFDLGGPLLPGWWGWPLIVLGALSAVGGMLQANREAELRPLVTAAGIGQLGLAVAGLGVAVVARAADLPPLAVLALGAALLQGFATALSGTVLLLAAVSVEEGAGTRRLDRLGGLVRGMRITTACTLAGAASMAALPPAAGFAGMWLLVQAMLGGLRIGGVGVEVTLTLAVAATGLAGALGAAAAVRLIGIGFLGRPRSPRGAAAEEAPRMARIALVAGTVLLLLLGLLPGVALGLVGPALHVLLEADIAGQSGVAMLVPLTGLPPYSALAVAGLVALTAIAAVWAARRWTVPGERGVAAWDSGFAAPPAWLPFGDPQTEPGPAGFSRELERLAAPLGRLAPARWLFRPVGAARLWLTGLAARLDAAIDGREDVLGIPVVLAVLAIMLLAAWIAGA